MSELGDYDLSDFVRDILQWKVRANSVFPEGDTIHIDDAVMVSAAEDEPDIRVVTGYTVSGTPFPGAGENPMEDAVLYLSQIRSDSLLEVLGEMQEPDLKEATIRALNNVTIDLVELRKIVKLCEERWPGCLSQD